MVIHLNQPHHPAMIRKVEWVVNMNLGGIALDSLSADHDFSHACSPYEFPLHHTVQTVLEKEVPMSTWQSVMQLKGMKSLLEEVHSEYPDRQKLLDLKCEQQCG